MRTLRPRAAAAAGGATGPAPRAVYVEDLEQERDFLLRSLSDLERERAAGDASVLGVVFEDDAASVRRFVAEQGVNWPMVQDPKGKIALDFGVRGPPESFLIDPNGVVLVKFIGEVKATQLDALVRQAEQSRA